MRSSNRRCIGQGEPECRQSPTFAMIVRYHTHCIFAPKIARLLERDDLQTFPGGGNTLSIFSMILSAHWMLAVISLSARGLPCGPPNRSSAVRMCRLARIEAMTPMTRLRPSSIRASYIVSCFLRHNNRGIVPTCRQNRRSSSRFEIGPRRCLTAALMAPKSYSLIVNFERQQGWGGGIRHSIPHRSTVVVFGTLWTGRLTAALMDPTAALAIAAVLDVHDLSRSRQRNSYEIIVSRGNSHANQFTSRNGTN